MAVFGTVMMDVNILFFLKQIQNFGKTRYREIKNGTLGSKRNWLLWDGIVLKPVIREQTLESLAYTLNHIYLNDRSVKLYEIQEDNQLLAAESDCDYMKENLK